MSLLKNTVIKNFSILTGTNLLIQLIGIISSIRLARALQPSGYGLMNLVINQATLFSIVAAFGLRLVVIRNIARKRESARKYFKIINRIRIFTTVLALTIAAGYNFLASDKALSSSLLVAMLLLILLQTLWDSTETIAFGLEKMEMSGIINLLFSISWVILLYLIPLKYCTVAMVLYISIVNQLIKTIIYIFWLQKSILRSLENSKEIIPKEYSILLKQSFSYLVLAIFTAIQNQVPILFLQFNSSMDQIGIFSLGNRILSPLQFVLLTLLTALFPMFSRLAFENKELFTKRVKSLLNILVLIGILGCFGFYLFSKDVVLLLYGEKYLDSANIILIQCWYTVLFGIFCIIGTVLSSTDKQNLLASLSIIYGLIATPIFYFGSKYGAKGLSWAFLIAAILNMTYHWVIFRKILQYRISVLYSAIIFVPLILFIFISSSFVLNIGIFFKIILILFLSCLILIYLYKIEYIKIKYN